MGLPANEFFFAKQNRQESALTGLPGIPLEHRGRTRQSPYCPGTLSPMPYPCNSQLFVIAVPGRILPPGFDLRRRFTTLQEWGHSKCGGNYFILLKRFRYPRRVNDKMCFLFRHFLSIASLLI